MGCAGTISWFQAGVAVPARKSFGEGRANAPSKPKTQDPWRSDAGPQLTPQQHSEQSGYAAERNPAGQTSAGQAVVRRVMEAGAQVEPDWSEVVRRCLSGESPAWTELVRAHHRRVYALCYRFTGSGTDAEDLTQDVFLKIYANLASFDTARGSLQVWITTLAVLAI
jgi:DNA-directed RNA polymerase sigma subunit (sigma70/sigma32)